MRPFKLMLLLCILFADVVSPKTVTAQSNLWVEAVAYANSTGGNIAEFHVSASKKLTPSFGVFGWAVSNKSWGESLAGVLYEPAKWISFQAGGGIEEDKNPWRSTASVWFGGARGSMFSVIEYGGSGFWYKGVGKLSLGSSPISAGYYAQRFEGVGPYAEMQLSHLMLYGSPIMFDPENHKARNALIALRFTP